MQNLVIVESPTKARTLSKFLGKDFRIEASMGHIRDLPKGELGIDIEKNFEPRYVIPRDKKKRVNELKKIANGAKNLYLATDPDREGEAIAWHLSEILKMENGKSKVERVVFHEITEEAIKQAFQSPRGLDYQLIDAQQARRVLDRIVGYKLSPLLWKKIKRGLSAGRVQSVALRLVVEREREIKAFKPVEYWSIEVLLEVKEKGETSRFFAALIEENGKKVEIKNEQSSFIRNKEDADKYVKVLEKADYKIEKVTKKEVNRYPSPPFITSTLQQTAGNKLGYSAKKTMMLAQNLYEQGFITYMRTDSVTLSSYALAASRDLIKQKFGEKYLPPTPRQFKSKSKNAQEAHEAIRPTNIKVMSDELRVKSGFTRDHAKLYDLIWKRTIASQMTEAILDQTTVDVSAISGSSKYTLRATGSVLKFDGWLAVYGIKQELEEDPSVDSGQVEEGRKQILPELKEGEDLNLIELLPKQHFTQSPPRYTEASLIKKLEELGIGRPSTYAPILSTIQERYYVEKEQRRFIATELGMVVVDFLLKYFPEVFDYQFSALMEDRLDEISRGEREWRETIGIFFGPLEKKLEKTMEEAEHVKLALEEVDKKCPKCGKNLVVRIGRFGKFLACSGFPECKHTEGLEQKINAKCPEDGGDVVIRKTKKRKTFYGCSNWPKCKYASWTKPKLSSPVIASH